MAAIKPCVTEHYHIRKMDKAIEVDDEIQLVHTVVCTAFTIAREVTPKCLKREGVNPESSEAQFEIGKEFLVSLIEPSIGSCLTKRKALSRKSIDKVKKFFQETHLSPYCFPNPQRISDPKEARTTINKISDPLQTAYRQHNNRFEKLPLPPPMQKDSCFYYVLLKSGFDARKFECFLLWATQGKRERSYQDYINFLKFEGREPASLPLKPRDILVYYNEKDEFSHAALVAEDPKYVYAKFGNDIPFAYKHKADQTPIEYGIKFKILR